MLKGVFHVVVAPRNCSPRPNLLWSFVVGCSGKRRHVLKESKGNGLFISGYQDLEIWKCIILVKNRIFKLSEVV